jgi:hypothetical protein
MILILLLGILEMDHHLGQLQDQGDQDQVGAMDQGQVGAMDQGQVGAVDQGQVEAVDQGQVGAVHHHQAAPWSGVWQSLMQLTEACNRAWTGHVGQA